MPKLELFDPAVVKTVNERGSESLPLILVNGKTVSMGGYPNKEELAAMTRLGGGANS